MIGYLRNKNGFARKAKPFLLLLETASSQPVVMTAADRPLRHPRGSVNNLFKQY